MKKYKELTKSLVSCMTCQDPTHKALRRKMVIVGDGGSGKTSLVTQMCAGQFVDVGYVPTVFDTTVLKVNTGKEKVKLAVHDTASQEDYDRLRSLSYSNADVVVISFSLTDRGSLTNVVDTWSQEARHFCKNVPMILVGNKKDLRRVSSTSSRNHQASMGSQFGESDCTLLNDAPPEQRSGCQQASPSTCASMNHNSSWQEDGPYQCLTTRVPTRTCAGVSHSEGTSLAKRIGATAYLETSALTADHVEELLLAVTKAAVLGRSRSKKFKPFRETLKGWRPTNQTRR